MFSIARPVVPRCHRILRAVNATRRGQRGERQPRPSDKIGAKRMDVVARAYNCKSNGASHKAAGNPRPPTSHVHRGDVTTMTLDRHDNDKLCNEDLAGGGRSNSKPGRALFPVSPDGRVCLRAVRGRVGACCRPPAGRASCGPASRPLISPGTLANSDARFTCRLDRVLPRPHRSTHAQ